MDAQSKETAIIASIWITIVGIVFAFIALIMYVLPQYSVYKARLYGEATHAEAEGSRLALVAQAKAEREAAEYRSEAIKIMGQAAKDYPEYRQQEFIGAFSHAIQDSKIDKMWFIPTEGNIPIIAPTHK